MKKRDKWNVGWFLAFGFLFLTLGGGWRVYADPLVQGGKRALEAAGFPAQKSDKETQADRRESGQERPDPEDSRRQNAQEPPVGNPGAPDGGTDASGEAESEGGLREWPKYVTVEDDYFADAVFIGDSRTAAMEEYGQLEEISTFYAKNGLSVHKLFTAKIVPVEGQKQKITIEEALQQRQFAKIYFMIGLNEMGTGTAESFLEKYAECVGHLRELQPDAVIYLQGIMQITAERSAKGDSFTNEGIRIRNEGIRAMADDETIFYLEVNDAVCGEDGTLIPAYTGDGVHLKAQYIALWKDYLKQHAVCMEEY